VLSEKKAEQFTQLLETRISELNRVLATAEQDAGKRRKTCRIRLIRLPLSTKGNP